ncbi:sodium:proton antiporter [Peptoniphilus sp. AGMB00490]|uniref:Sodium:proton antiporter n=1 Tax=Peptoniphilus faecalis TaxID=2731255 RepID=A0A848R6W5_9FIRM|nr:Na+/H+ antiporter NhaC family protein [Peptoniphilus faecalis]NMW85027.1 sodium:proton antiporter [Peptoniphilus faecalis]
MFEICILILFMLNLFVAIVFKIQLAFALFLNLMLLSFYAYIKNFSLREISTMIYTGIKSTKTILIVFSLIGMIIGIWRLSGTIAYIIYHGTSLINPRFFYVGIFIFNAIISFLTGTSFGTASTAGIISMSISNAMSFNPLISGGAILSGCFFGDRSSPMSTSALLVATLTKTDLYKNLKNMFRTCIIPLVLTILTYQIFNLGIDAKIDNGGINLIKEIFNFNLFLMVPPLSIILLSIFKVDLKINMLISIVLSIFFAAVFQNKSASEIIKALIFGFHINSDAGKLINGGGFISMLKMLLIVGISSGYFGFFKETQLLVGVKKFIKKLFSKFPDMAIMSIMSILISVFSSNQTLSIMLTYEMARESYKDNEKLALDIENTAVMTAAYIPWNIAGRTPLEMFGAPIMSLYFSFYHHYIVLINTLASVIEFRKTRNMRNK